MAYQYIGKDIYKQLEQVINQVELSNKLNKELMDEIKLLNKKIIEKDEKIDKLLLEIERLKTIINKDSSNSSKPSSTNGYKKVITNRREPSKLKKGGQKNHEFHCLDENKVQELIDKGAKVEVIEVNKNNKSKEYKTLKVIDIKIDTIIKEYRYYPDEFGNYDIPFQNIVYGSNVKALATSLMYQFPNSTDGVKEIINSITNDGISLSKGTLINWSNELTKNLSPEIEKIEEELLNSYYINSDESSIKINSNSSNVICSSNKSHTRLWIGKTKKHEDLENIGFLSKYLGIIVKDGTDIYNGFGSALSQCNSHILRYLKGVYDFVAHKGAKDMALFLVNAEEERQKLIANGKHGFTTNRYEELILEYNNIIKLWKREWMNDNFNPVNDDERRLLSRMEETDKQQILYFLEDFKVPFSNNQAEADQRSVKIKQKIGKFRSETGADNYAIIRSCVNTYKKNSINVLKAFVQAFDANPIII